MLHTLGHKSFSEMLKMYYIFHFACYSKGYLWYQNFCENVFSNYTNSTTNFFAERKPETFSVFNFNEEPYTELQSDNDQGQRNVGTLNKYAHFSTWKTSVYISITDQKNTTIFLEVDMNSYI